MSILAIVLAVLVGDFVLAVCVGRCIGYGHAHEVDPASATCPPDARSLMPQSAPLG